MTPPVIRIKRLRPQEDADIPLPRYMTKGSAGMDVAAAVKEPLTILPGEIKTIPTGFAFAIPPGFEIQVRPRSGLAIRHGLAIPNAPGTIDSDYRGELQVALINLGSDPYRIEPGERIAQLVIAPVTRVEVVETDDLSQTDRGSGGFGSTGR